MIHFYTSFNFNYLNRAYVLAETLRKYHPDCIIWGVIVDMPPPDYSLEIEKEKFDNILWVNELFQEKMEQWLFGHNVVEACTAVKGEALRHIFKSGAQKVVYLDPDIAVFGPLDSVEKLLESHSIILTPHQLEAEETDIAVIDNEICSLLHGVYNLGFLAVKNDHEGRKFADWWSLRLKHYCHDRKAEGIFVDQKWCDLVPCFFERVHILRDPGYNVASWNLSKRNIEISNDGDIKANGYSLKFYHFTKLGNTGYTMTEKYANGNMDIFEIWSWYSNKVKEYTTNKIPVGWWYFDYFENGIKVPQVVRELYRTREDLREAFPNPRASKKPSFYEWLKDNKIINY